MDTVLQMFTSAADELQVHLEKILERQLSLKEYNTIRNFGSGMMLEVFERDIYDAKTKTAATNVLENLSKINRLELLSMKGWDRRASRSSGAFHALLDTGSQSGAGYALRAGVRASPAKREWIPSKYAWSSSCSINSGLFPTLPPVVFDCRRLTPP
jgi:hypothetical protein